MKVFLICLFAILSTTIPLRAMEKVVSDAGHYVLTLGSPLDQLRIGHYQSLELLIEDAFGQRLPGADIVVKGGMPGHGHGLPTSPKAVEIGEGLYRVNGLKFTMPGLWELMLEVQRDGITDFAIIKFKL